MTTPQDIVSTEVVLSPPLVPLTFGQTLYLGTEDVLDGAGVRKSKAYGNLAAVAADFALGTEPYTMAQRYFGQNPFPKALVVGRWVNGVGGIDTEIRGGAHDTLAPLIAAGTGVADGSLRLEGVSITGINLQGNADADAVADTLQVAIRAASPGGGNDWTGMTVAYSNNRFLATFDPAVTDITGVFSAAAAGTDLSDSLGLDVGSGAVARIGAQQETIGEALTEIRRHNADWHGLVLSRTMNDDTDAMNGAHAWCEANGVMFSGESNAPQALVTDESVSIGAILSLLQPQNTMMLFSRTADYKAASAQALLSAVNFEGGDTAITLKFKQLFGTARDLYPNPAHQAELNRKRMNHFSNIFAEGTMLHPAWWADQRWWLLWFVWRVQLEVFNSLARARRVPQTPAGQATILAAARRVCRLSVGSGFVGPGQLDPEYTAILRRLTGQMNHNGFLSSGFYVHMPSVFAQSQIQRETRISPRMSILTKGQGAFHGVDNVIYFQQ